MTAESLPLRQAVRALMIDHADRLLLVKLEHPPTGWVGWILPGGGIESGENPIDALRRELHEETGLADPFIGPIVCHLQVVGGFFGSSYSGQQEAIHLVPCHEFPLEPALAEHELRNEGIIDMRWFTRSELVEMAEIIKPDRLIELFDRVLEFGGSVDPLIIEAP